MNTKYLAIAVAVIVVVGGGMFLLNNRSATTPTVTEEETQPTVTEEQAGSESVVLAEQNASGEEGIAALTEEDGKTVVTLTMTGATADVAQPAHIHSGACPAPGAVVYPLTNVVDGSSVTTLDVPLSQLQAELPLAINVHKSEAESDMYVSCGDISL